MMKKFILSILFSTLLFGSNLKIDDKIDTFSLTNQFDKMETITADTTTIIVTFDNKSIDLITKYLAKKTPDFLISHHAVFVANITHNPSVETRIFTLPKLRDCKYSVMLLHDEKNLRFAKQAEKITIYKINNGIVNNISYVDSEQKLEEFF